jgi:hypothetical protein
VERPRREPMTGPITQVLLRAGTGVVVLVVSGDDEVVSGADGTVRFAEGVIVGCEGVVNVEMGNGTGVEDELLVAVADAAAEAIKMLVIF